jgi:hypothetical protein
MIKAEECGARRGAECAVARNRSALVLIRRVLSVQRLSDCIAR